MPEYLVTRTRVQEVTVEAEDLSQAQDLALFIPEFDFEEYQVEPITGGK